MCQSRRRRKCMVSGDSPSLCFAFALSRPLFAPAKRSQLNIVHAHEALLPCSLLFELSFFLVPVLSYSLVLHGVRCCYSMLFFARLPSLCCSSQLERPSFR